ncbi:hypothetical protein HDU86_005891 [Geranomyces michiganensis]|nr:hypothetical protein HDU86_005891 [Geranomyces michiganensis]
MIVSDAPNLSPAQPSSSALPYLSKTGSNSVLAANSSRRVRYNEDDDSDVEDTAAGPALAAEDMGLDLDEELEHRIFGHNGEDSSARHQIHRKSDTKARKKLPTAAPQPVASHEYNLRIKELEHVNSQLRASLLLSSQEVKALRQEALEQSINGATPEDGREIGDMGAREAKIILLAKKQQQLEAKPVSAPIAARDTRDETRALRDKVAQVTRKLEEERTAGHALRAEVRAMHQALRREIGEELPLAQAKIQTLMANHNANGNGNAVAASGSASPGPGSGSYDSSHRAAIRRIENERKAAMEVSITELEETRRSLEEAKRKCDAVVARNRLLERDLKQKKRDVEILVRKAGTDDRLIAALRVKCDKQAHKPECAGAEPCLTCAERALVPALQPQPQPQTAPLPSPTLDTLSATATASSLQLENAHLLELRSALETRAFNAAARIADLTTDLARERRKSGKDKTGGQLITDIEEVNEKLALLSDENAALRTTLRTTQETTREEIEIFNSLLKKSREGFQRDLEAIARHVQKQLGEHD